MDTARLRQQVEERFLRSAKEHAARTGDGKGLIGIFSSGGRVSPEGDASFSMSGWEGNTLVKVEHRVFRGHKLEIEERFSISGDKKLLRYSQMVKGPAGEQNSHEIEFEIMKSEE